MGEGVELACGRHVEIPNTTSNREVRNYIVDIYRVLDFTVGLLIFFYVSI